MSTPAVLAPRRIARADASQIEMFRDVPVGNIVDALGRSGALDYRIKPVTSAARFVGTALPVDAGPRDNLAPWAALRLARPGDVLMIATGGYLDASVCGDVLAGLAANGGLLSIVTDGAVRDRSGIAGTGLPVFAAGVSPNSPQKNGPGSVGLPVTIGGVPVGAGDIVCGDEDGVVVVSAGRIDEALSALTDVRAKESAMDASVRAGHTMPAWVGEPDLDALFTLVDDRDP